MDKILATKVLIVSLISKGKPFTGFYGLKTTLEAKFKLFYDLSRLLGELESEGLIEKEQDAPAVYAITGPGSSWIRAQDWKAIKSTLLADTSDEFVRKLLAKLESSFATY